MNIHELNTKAITNPAYVALDDGSDTYKLDLNAKLSTMQSSISGAESDIATAQADITLLQTNMGQAQGAISSAQGEIEDLQSDLNALSTQTAASIGNLQTEVDAVEDDVTDLKGDLKATVDGIDITARGVTPLFLKSGDAVIIDVTEIDGNVNCFISGYTSTNVLLINAVGHYSYVAENNGYLNFYFLTATKLTAKVWRDTNIYDVLLDVDNLNSATFRKGSLALETGSFEDSTGALVPNSARLCTKNYIKNDITKIIFSADYYAYIYAYKNNGDYVGVYTGNGWTTSWQNKSKVFSPINMLDFSDYYYKAVFVRSDGGTATEQTLDLSTVINNIIDKEEVYTVGTNGDYTSFTEMLSSLQNNSNLKTVYIYGGVYDIFDEMGGADFIASVDTSANWRDVNYIVPPNTTIIGIGDVVLTWNPTDTEIIDNAHAFLFSPLNLSGNCTIKNIKIQCSNCRYGIHDETSGRSVYDGTEHFFENVSVTYNASTFGTKYAYGAGHNRNSKYRFRNCVFSSGYGYSWSTHDWNAGINENSLFEIDNCVFWDNASNALAALRFSSSDIVGRLDDVKISGCSFNNLTFSTEGSIPIKQGYMVQTILCKPYTVTYSNLIDTADRIAPVNYLQLGN